MGLLHKDLSYELRGCFYHVQNEVGLGYDEETYHLALEQYLKKKGISFESKVVRYIEHKGKRVHKFIADFVIEGKIILELKSISSDFVPANYLQILSYLKCWKLDLGLLVNFGQQSVKIKRVLFTERVPNFTEEYREIELLININNRKDLRTIRQSIIAILSDFGLGYDSKVYKKLLVEEFHHNKLPFSPDILIPVTFEEKIIRNFELKFPLVSGAIICGIYAVQEDLMIDFSKMKNYLKTTKNSIGLMIHFGKEKLEIIGICP